jgi:hypothetical protein
MRKKYLNKKEYTGLQTKLCKSPLALSNLLCVFFQKKGEAGLNSKLFLHVRFLKSLF